MIGRIRGTLIEKQPPTICVDVGGSVMKSMYP